MCVCVSVYVCVYACVCIQWHFGTFCDAGTNTQGRYDMVGFFFWHPILIYMSVCIYILTLSINTQGTPKDDMTGIFLAARSDLFECVCIYTDTLHNTPGWYDGYFFGIPYWLICVCVYVCVCVYTHFPSRVISFAKETCHLKFEVSFAEYCLFCRALLQKRPVICVCVYTLSIPRHSQRLTMMPCRVQGASSCRSLSANEPLITGLCCGKWLVKRRHSFHLCHLVALYMGWLRLVGSLKLMVSFAKEPYKRDNCLQKRPRILRSLLLVATPYSVFVYICV